MAKDFIPQADAEFAAWLDNFITTATKSKSKLNINDPALEDLAALANTFKSSVAAAQQAQVALDTKVQAKKQARAAVEAAARGRVRQVQAEPGVTDEDRAALRISLRAAPAAPANVPDTRPIVTIDTSERLRHRLDYRDSATSNRRAKPAGAMGCEIHVFIGPQPPADPAEFRLLDVDPATPYIVNYTGADAGKTAHYLLRWVNGRGERGPWSDTTSATITG
jgi:hypothetical protein